MKAALKVKSSRLETLSLRLHTADLTQLAQFLNEKKAKYQIFNAMPFVLDLDDLADDDADLSAILSLFAEQKMHIVAVRGNEQRWAEKVQAAGLFFLKHSSQKIDDSVKTKTVADEENGECNAPKSDKDEQEQSVIDSSENLSTPTETSENNEKQPTTETNEPIARPTLVVNTPVRTGQQVYAKNADLIVMGMVSEGAEVIADGNIHVYAPLRGRALAGESGDKNARIFVQSMQAELVSIAGIYRVFEQHLPPHLHKHAVKVELQEDERLAISAIVAQ